MRTRERETVRMGANREGRDEAKRTECVFDANAKSESGKRGVLSIVESRVGSPKIFSPSILPAPRGPIFPRFEIGHVPDSSDARIRRADPENGMKKYGRPFPSRKRVMPIIITGPVANRRARTIEFHVAERGDRKAGVE